MNLTMKIIILVGMGILGGIGASFINMLLSRFLGEVYGTWIGGIVMGFIIVLIAMTTAYLLFKR